MLSTNVLRMRGDDFNIFPKAMTTARESRRRTKRRTLLIVTSRRITRMVKNTNYIQVVLLGSV
jgi:hypothetical protein